MHQTFTCRHCNQTFTCHHCNQTFTCHHCNQTFTCHHCNQTFTCRYCNQTFTCHHCNQTFTCRYCNQTFTCRYCNQTFTCRHCNQTFTCRHCNQTCRSRIGLMSSSGQDITATHSWDISSGAVNTPSSAQQGTTGNRSGNEHIQNLPGTSRNLDQTAGQHDFTPGQPLAARDDQSSVSLFIGTERYVSGATRGMRDQHTARQHALDSMANTVASLLKRAVAITETQKLDLDTEEPCSNATESDLNTIGSILTAAGSIWSETEDILNKLGSILNLTGPTPNETESILNKTGPILEKAGSILSVTKLILNATESIIDVTKQTNDSNRPTDAAAECIDNSAAECINNAAEGILSSAVDIHNTTDRSPRRSRNESDNAADVLIRTSGGGYTSDLGSFRDVSAAHHKNNSSDRPAMGKGSANFASHKPDATASNSNPTEDSPEIVDLTVDAADSTDDVTANNYNQKRLRRDHIPSPDSSSTSQANWSLPQRMQTRPQSIHAQYACTVCGEKFRQKPALDQHILTHSRLVSVFCSRCREIFGSKTNLKRPVSPSGERSDLCINCGQVINA